MDASTPRDRDDRAWHALDAAAALAALGSSTEGLSEDEAARRLARFGANELPRPPGPNFALIVLRQFKSPLIYLLLAAAVVSVALGELRDAAFIAVVLAMNALIGGVQEWRAARGAAALDRLVRQQAVVWRGGHRVQLDGAVLVPGDVVELESGMRAPADIRLVSAREAKSDESLLTGESLPVDKRADTVLAAEAVVGDRINMLHAGSTLIAGRASGVVARTGLATELGRIAQALAGEAAPPPLLLRLERFTRWLGIVIVALIALLAIVELGRGSPVEEVFFVAVALAVSAIPEGLPVAISIALSIAAHRMAQARVIVRALPAVEGLGACTIIATDKTGTLTLNALTVKRLWLPGHGDCEVEGEGYRAAGSVAKDGAPPQPEATAAARMLATAGLLCNEASWHQDADGTPHHLGDTVDVALLVLAAKLGLDCAAIAAAHPASGAIPFESHRRFAAHFTADPGSPDGAAGHWAWVKGAAEAVLPMCREVDEDLAWIATAMAADGYRVLALAAGPAGAPDAAALRDLEFLGFVGLIDPIRPAVPEAIARARRAGVAVAMVTGDHPETALAIGRSLGLAAERAEVVTGAELQALAADRARFDRAVAGARIFARVEPTQKLAIVEALQRAGHFVTVTGDGVNDAPALRAAHIGVAMGRDGTDAARASADLILTDDNFASIVAGIELGRVAYDNIRKVVLLLVSTGAAEIVLFALALFAGLPLPLLAVQLLWLNLVTNGLQHVALALERGEPGVLDRPPRPPAQPILDRRMVEALLLSGAVMGGVAFVFFERCLAFGLSEAAARNAVLLLMVTFENVHVFNCRSETRSVLRIPVAVNPYIVPAVIGAQGLHIGAMYLPGLSDALRIAPVSLGTWLTVVAVALSLVAAMEAYKAWRRSRA